MKRNIILTGIFCLFLSACRTFPPVHNITRQLVPDGNKQKIEQAVVAGAMSKGWEVSKIDESTLLVSLVRRGHQVKTVISYGDDFYSITYKDSQNLNYNAKKGTIHSRYNTWIVNLNHAIQMELATK